jgi:myo-inositol-1(or 4)-monophosphatase
MLEKVFILIKHKSKMLDVAIKAAKEAGKILMKYYGKDYEINSKRDSNHSSDLVTQADLDSEKKIVDILEKNFPEHRIYAEEQGLRDKDSEYTWYIDPLDGTGNFTRNIPLFGVSIGLIKNKQPILGVLYFPAIDLMVHAEKGKGAFANDKKISVSNRELDNSLFYNAGVYKGKIDFKTKIAEKVALTKMIDTSAYELAQIAMGDAELYILTSVLHDVTAGVAIIREAGGKVTDYDDSEWNQDSKGIVASNKVIHDEIIGLL